MWQLTMVGLVEIALKIVIMNETLKLLLWMNTFVSKGNSWILHIHYPDHNLIMAYQSFPTFHYAENVAYLMYIYSVVQA